MSLELSLDEYQEFTQLAVSVEEMQDILHERFLAFGVIQSYCDTIHHDRILIEEFFGDSGKSLNPALVRLMQYLFQDWEEKEIEKQLKECED